MILTQSDARSLSQHDLSGTFAGLMDLYECNYIGIRRLAPVIPAPGQPLISLCPGNLALHLTVLERFRYTSEINLTYHFFKSEGVVAEPDLRVRVYHDARLAEVMSAHLRHWPPFEADSENSHLYQRWRTNRFLYKWLSYCLRQGHCFEPAE